MPLKTLSSTVDPALRVRGGTATLALAGFGYQIKKTERVKGVRIFIAAAAMTAAIIGGTRSLQAAQPATVENYFASAEPTSPASEGATAEDDYRRYGNLGSSSNLASYSGGYTGYPAAYAVVPADVDPATMGEVQYGYVLEGEGGEFNANSAYSMTGFNEAIKNDEGIPTPPPAIADGNGGSASARTCSTAGRCTTGACPTLSCCNDCCEPFWAHRSGVFGEFLILRPRGADVAYALPRNGVDPSTAVPFGGVATANPNYSPSGFRLGAVYALDRCSSIQGAYTYFNEEADGSVFANPPLSIHSLVTDPHTFTSASDSLAALSRYRIGFQLADIDYRRLIAAGQNWSLNYAVGSRYAHLTQQFRELQPIGPGATGVGTNVNFDGIGSRVGLLGERKAYNRGFLFYGKAFADILVGNFRSDYRQVNNFQQTQVWTSWKDFRPVPILEYELGAGWQNQSGRLRISGGYYFACWFNTVSTSNYIQAVQTNNYVNVGNAITFDGFVSRLQYVW